MTISGSGASARSNRGGPNEDSYLAHDGLGLYVVCDGASEGPAGELAATTAVEAIEGLVRAEREAEGDSFLRNFTRRNVALRAVRAAMDAVVSATAAEEHRDGMATTISLVLIHGHTAAVAHVGDSRVYLARAGQLHQLTSDLDLTASQDVETADVYGDTRVESFTLRLEVDDSVILCTDGAEDAVETAQEYGIDFRDEPGSVAEALVEAASRIHPERDATAVVVRVLGEEAHGWLWLSREARIWTYGHILRPA